MRVKNFAITLAVLAIGATPAVAATQTALRAVPRPAAGVIRPAAVWIPAPVKPAAVWIPTPSAGIKWSVGGIRTAVWGR